MKALIISAVALLVGVVGQGCSTTTAADAERPCTPGSYIICKCAAGDNGGVGTKLCAEDGKSFGACSTNNRGECLGGEVPTDDGDPVKPPDVVEPTPIASDDCPGQDTTVQPGITLQINGDTSNATKDRQGNGSCDTSIGANDQVFHLKPAASGTMKVVVTRKDSTLDPVVYLRTVCDDLSSQASCGKAGSANGGAQLQRGVGKDRDYYLFVDGASGSKGAYTASITLTAGAVCGDGIVDTGEACDDGNNNDGDGCSASCRNPSGNPEASVTCPGQDVHLWTAGTSVTATGSNRDTRGANVWANPGNDCTKTSTSTSPLHVYRVTPHVTGTLTVDLSGSAANLMLVARTTCDSADSQLASTTLVKSGCSNDGLSGGAEKLTGIAVTSGTPLFIGVKGGATTNNIGDYSIAFRVQ